MSGTAAAHDRGKDGHGNRGEGPKSAASLPLIHAVFLSTEGPGADTTFLAARQKSQTRPLGVIRTQGGKLSSCFCRCARWLARP